MEPRHASAVVMMVGPLASALACLLACTACVHEAPTRPLQSAGDREPSPRSSAPLPLPEGAFSSEDGPRAAGAAPRSEPRSRFETRRIGADEAGARPRYRGALVDLDVKNAGLANVFRLLSDVGHVNIVVSGELSGTITVSLKRVPWDQALDVIARAKDLEVEHDGNVILVKKR